jgi:hypothetical protein
MAAEHAKAAERLDWEQAGELAGRPRRFRYSGAAEEGPGSAGQGGR